MNEITPDMTPEEWMPIMEAWATEDDRRRKSRNPYDKLLLLKDCLDAEDNLSAGSPPRSLIGAYRIARAERMAAERLLWEFAQ